MSLILSSLGKAFHHFWGFRTTLDAPTSDCGHDSQPVAGDERWEELDWLSLSSSKRGRRSPLGDWWNAD